MDRPALIAWVIFNFGIEIKSNNNRRFIGLSYAAGRHVYLGAQISEQPIGFLKL